MRLLYPLLLLTTVLSSLTIGRLEELMFIAPKHEQSLFFNRDKFDLVVIYDESSTELGEHDSPLSILVRLIGGQAIHKMLKRMPMLLTGGIKAWRQECGEFGIIRGGISALDLQKPSYSNSPCSCFSSLSVLTHQ